MTINFDTTAYTKMIENFSKSLTYTPVTVTHDNLSEDESFTDGTPVTISAAFFRKEDSYNLDKWGLLENADAVLVVLPAQDINKNDKITYDGETYRVKDVVTRRLGTNTFYKAAACFKM